MPKKPIQPRFRFEGMLDNYDDALALFNVRIEYDMTVKDVLRLGMLFVDESELSGKQLKKLISDTGDVTDE